MFGSSSMIYRAWNYSVAGKGWQSCTYQVVLSVAHYVLWPLEAYNYPLQNTAAWVWSFMFYTLMSDGSFLNHSSQYLGEVDQYYYNHYLSPTWWINWISTVWTTLLKLIHIAYIMSKFLNQFFQCLFNAQCGFFSKQV